MNPADRELEEMRRLVEQHTATLQQIRDSQAQIMRYVQFGDLVRQQTQLLMAVQQNQANVLKSFQEYQNMLQQFEKLQTTSMNNPLNFNAISAASMVPSFPIPAPNHFLPQQPNPQFPSALPGMPQPGMPLPGMPQPGMPQPGMPQPGFPMPVPSGPQTVVNSRGIVIPQFRPNNTPVEIPDNFKSLMDHFHPEEKTIDTRPKPCVVPTPAHLFNPEKDCMNLRKAMKGLGTNERKIINILGARSNNQRQIIRKTFSELFPKRDLIKDLISETSGNFKNILVALMMTPEEFDAYSLNVAIRGIGTDDNGLIEILCSRSGEQIRTIRNIYKQKYGDLDRDITEDTSGDYRTLLLTLAQGNRSLDPCDPVKAKEDAMKLYKAGEDRIGTDENTFIEVLSQRSLDHLKMVVDFYIVISDYDLERSIKREMSRDLKKALIAIIKIVKSPIEYFADRLEDTMAGLGTDDTGLIRVIVTRSEIDLQTIKTVYFKKYGRTLEGAVKSETSGDYKKLLLMLMGNNLFNPDEDAKKLRRAMKGFGTDEDTIVNILCARSHAQRLQIAATFKTNYARDLLKDLKSETSGDFKDLLEAMMMDYAELDAWTVKKCIEGLGTDDDTLIEILATRSNFQIKQLKEVYQKTYNRSIEQDVHDDTSGDYRNLLKALLKAERDESTYVNLDEAKADAAALYKAGAEKIGTDEDVFIKILTVRNYHQLRLIFDCYDQVCDHNIVAAIKAETSFNFKKCLVTIVESTQDPSRYFAKRIHDAMDGVGTNEAQLIRIIITRCEIDMPQIRDQYRTLFKASLERDLSGDTSGHFKRGLKKIIETFSGAV